jgi:hypothetical protein
MAAVLVLVLGCSDPSAAHLAPDSIVTSDSAGAATTSCGAPIPTTAPSTITLRSSLDTYPDRVAFHAATVEAYRFGDSAPIASVVVDDVDYSGGEAFTLTIPTNGVPFNGYLRASIGFAGYLDAYWFPETVLAADTERYDDLIFVEKRQAWSVIEGVPDAHRGIVNVYALDCDGHDVMPMITATSPAIAHEPFEYGWTVIERDEGATTITVSSPTMQWPARTIDVRGNMWAVMLVLPL